MRICLYVGKAPQPEQLEQWLIDARTTCDIYARNLYHEFTRRGHEVVWGTTLSGKPKIGYYEGEEQKRYDRYRGLHYPEADHAICLQQNGWARREPIFFEMARAATKGLMTAICDHDGDIQGPQDVLFVARRPTRDPARSHYVGWAADPDVFKPEQDPEWLTIFIDHKANPNGDHTEALLKSATTYAADVAASGRKVGTPPRRVRVVFFSPDGIDVVEPGDIRDVDLGNNIREFYRTRVPGPEMQHWLRKTDIFVVTHGESMGLPVLESAMSGALVVARRGYIRPEFLQPLAHHEYENVEDVDWDQLVERLDPPAFRERALHFTWGRIAERMLDTLSGRGPTPAPAQRVGDRLIVPPTPVSDTEFGSLSRWQKRGAQVISDGSSERLVAVGEGKHLVQRTIRKNPWPELFTLSFQVRPAGCESFRASFWAYAPEDRVEVQFDTVGLMAHPGQARAGWSAVDARIVPVGDSFHCHVAVITDWAPILNCSLTLAQGSELSFEGDGDTGIAISRLRLNSGAAVTAELSTAGAADVGAEPALAG